MLRLSFADYALLLGSADLGLSPALSAYFWCRGHPFCSTSTSKLSAFAKVSTLPHQGMTFQWRPGGIVKYLQSRIAANLGRVRWWICLELVYRFARDPLLPCQSLSLNLSDFKIIKDSFEGCVLLRLVQHGENGFVFSSSEDRNSSFDGDCINHQGWSHWGAVAKFVSCPWSPFLRICSPLLCVP